MTVYEGPDEKKIMRGIPGRYEGYVNYNPNNSMKLVEISPGISEIHITQVPKINKEALNSYINSLDKDVLVDYTENIEKNETIFKFTPYGKNSTFLSGLNNTLYFDGLLEEDSKICITNHNSYIKKVLAKREAKNSINTKYKIGDILILKSKIKDGSKKYYKKFEVKKVIWSIRNNPVNILILKQISGINNNLSLDRNDCKKYHIKYEPGLQAYSMMLNFVKTKK